MSPKPRLRKPAKPAAAPPPAPAADRGAPWPAGFGSPRRAIVCGAALLVLGIALYLVAQYAGLLWIKRPLAWMLGLENPRDVFGQSADLAGVIFGFAAVIAGGLVHVSVGLAALFLARPWLDGYTYPTDNMYFLWALLLLAGGWALRMFRRGGSFRDKAALAAVGGFLAIGLITAPAGAQMDQTYRQLLYWTGYALVLLLATNAVRTPAARGTLLAGLIASAVVQSGYAVLHFEYLLPYMRKMVQDPQLLRHFFGTDTMTPELARRFEINRAFGSLLFPNALAAFLLLAIPYTLFGGIAAWRALLPAWAARAPIAAPDQPRRAALAAAACAWAAIFFALVGALTFISGYQAEQAQLGAVGIFVVALIASALPAGAIAWCAQTYGLVLCGLAVRALGLAAAAPLFLYTLWITYSRGGLLALFAAMIAGAALATGLAARIPGARRRAGAAAAALAVVIAVAAAAAPRPAEAQGPAPIESVTEAGQRVGVQELADPASFRIRLTYWRVGLDLFRHHWATGVGLGNFKTVYPKYQYLGAGNVKEAHNAFVQVFCETGIVGGIWFTAAWALLLAWGARRILAETDRGRRLALAGLWTGIAAFLLHAAIDINFSHPTLVMFLMAYVGLFLGAARPGTASGPESGAGGGGARAAALAIMVGCALAAGAATRPYLQDLSLSRLSFINVGSRHEMIQRLQIGAVLLRETVYRSMDGEKNRPLARIPVAEVAKLVPDLARIRQMGDIYAPHPVNPREARLIGRQEAVPENAFVVLMKPWYTLRTAFDFLDPMLSELERIDARFPHTVEIPMHLVQWYTLALPATGADEFKDRRPHVRARLAHWAEEGVRRSPLLADAHLVAAEAYWAIAGTESGGAQRAAYRRSLELHARACELNAVLGDYNVYYAHALEAVAKGLEAAGEADEAAAHRARAAEEMALGNARQQARWQLGL